MAKEFAIVTKPAGATAIGTISTISKTNTGDKHTSKDENGNVDGENFNAKVKRVEAEMELSTRAASVDVGDTLAAVDFGDGDGALDYSITESAINEANTGDPNTYTLTAEYDVPTAP